MHYVPDIMVSKVSILILILYYFHWSIDMENSHIEHMFKYINSKPIWAVWRTTAMFLWDTEKLISALKAYFIWPFPFTFLSCYRQWSLLWLHTLIAKLCEVCQYWYFLNGEFASSPEKRRNSDHSILLHLPPTAWQTLAVSILLSAQHKRSVNGMKVTLPELRRQDKKIWHEISERKANEDKRLMGEY